MKLQKTIENYAEFGTNPRKLKVDLLYFLLEISLKNLLMRMLIQRRVANINISFVDLI